MIFLTLCIAIYSLLSLLAAENELSLNLKNRDASIEFYAADAAAAIIISEIASMKARGEDPALATGDVNVDYDPATHTVSFIVPIDTYRNLDISFSFPDSGSHFTMNRYSVVNSLDWQEQARGRITVITEFD